MKVAYRNTVKDPADIIKQEIAALEALIKEHPGNEKAHSRLMILYRKKGDPKQELKTINRAIRVFEQLFRKTTPPVPRAVRSLSQAIAKATGLLDPKGNHLYEKGELAKWKRRKEVVLKKVK